MPFRSESPAARRASLPIARLGLAVLLLGLAACREHGIERGKPSASAQKPAQKPAQKTEAPAALLDCDDLPPLSPEEIARLPRAPLLDKAAPTGPRGPVLYTLLPDVTLSDEVATKVARIDDGYARRTREHLVITSGQRDPARQAMAMFKVLQFGGDILRLYRNKAAAREILAAYEANRDRDTAVTVGAMHAVIKAQIARGIYISAHLKDGAVDIRNRGMSTAERQAFLKAVDEVGGVSVLEESKPPHYHLQME